MRLPHRRTHSPVARQLLHRPDVVPVRQQMRRKAVPQRIAIGREARAIVRVLDGFNRTRFRGDDAMLAAWKSAKNVAGPFTRSEEGTPTSAPAPTTPPKSGGASKVA